MTAHLSIDWREPALRDALAAGWPGLGLELQPELDSTNSELMRRARAGCTAALLLVAERQTAGRGRQGRVWHASPEQSLTFSLGLPLQPADWSGLSLALGVALAEALDSPTSAAPRIQLKWPNDLWLQGGKLAGILVETLALPQPHPPAPGRYLVVGVGLNLQTPALPAQDPPPIGLDALHPRMSAPRALCQLVTPLLQALSQFEREGLAPFLPRFECRDLLRERRLRLGNGLEGTGQGISPTGALRLHTAQGLQELASAQWSVRPC